MCDSDSRQASALDEMDVTPEMIEAGAAELREKRVGENPHRIVEAVFWAMWVSRPAKTGPRS